MKHCEILHKDLFDYVEKQMPPVLIRQLDKHISECDECNRIVAEFRGIVALIEEQKYIEPRPFAETRILQAVESRMGKSHNSYSPKFRILQPAAISFGVAAALVVGFMIGSDFAETHSVINENNEIIDEVRSDLNVPEFMSDDIFQFTE
ncbi:MAG: anti-sigma factor family protein [Bacteroidales bacterium]